jgi:hypothetical protein
MDAIERVDQAVTVHAAAELLRVELVDVVSVLADWALQSPQPRTLGVWDGAVIGKAGLQMIRAELAARDGYPTKPQLAAARAWCQDCTWPYGDEPNPTDDEVIAFVVRMYGGGWLQFLADVIPLNLSRENANTATHETEH